MKSLKNWNTELQIQIRTFTQITAIKNNQEIISHLQKKDVKEEDKSEFDESDKSNKRNMQERNYPHTLSDISLLCKEIKGHRDYIKVWMEKLIAPLNTIANQIF